MSAFIGSANLGPDGTGPFAGPMFLPDQPGLRAARVWRGRSALLIHRQRTVTPQDRFETQPTPILEGKGALLFDGRLDDRAGLFHRLGIVPREDVPDSVLVGHAFEKWGEEAPLHLLGVFALAVLDYVQRRLVLATDPLGTRTLYFYRNHDLLTFSTVLPALLRAPGVPRELDEAMLAGLLINDYRDNRCSFFRGIRRVLGGETMVCSAGKERALDHWPLNNVKPLKLQDDREYVLAAREVLDLAVRSCMRSIEPVPLMGSGGLDSSCLVVSALGVNNGSQLSMVTILPEAGAETSFGARRYASEREPVEAMQAAFPRLSTYFVEPERHPDLEFAPEIFFEQAAVPIRGGTGGWADAAYTRIQQIGSTSFLHGGAGNFAFSWDGAHGLSSLFRYGRWFSLGREAAALGRYRLRSTAGYIWRDALKPNLLGRTRPEGWHRNGSINRQTEAELKNSGRLEALADDGGYAGPPSHGLLMKHWLIRNRVLLSEFGAAFRARYGLEARFPLIDVRLLRFCMQIPVSQFLRGRQTRWLARRVLRQAGVPAQIWNSTERGAPCPDWFAHMNRRKDDLPHEIARLRNSPLCSRLIDVDRLTGIVVDWPTDAAAAQSRKLEIEIVLARALHVGAFIRWAEAKDWSGTEIPIAAGVELPAA